MGRLNSANLTPASGRQDHTTSPYAATSLVRTLGDRSQAFRQPALPSRCAPNAAASTASHPASLTIRIRPSVGRDAKSSRSDLGYVGTEISFGKSEIRLDSPVNKPPDGQITTRLRKQIPLVSRTRAACSRRCQRVTRMRARWQAPHRPVTLLRRAGTYIDMSQVGPGSAGRDTPALPRKNDRHFRQGKAEDIYSY